MSSPFVKVKRLELLKVLKFCETKHTSETIHDKIKNQIIETFDIDQLKDILHYNLLYLKDFDKELTSINNSNIYNNIFKILNNSRKEFIK